MIRITARRWETVTRVLSRATSPAEKGDLLTPIPIQTAVHNDQVDYLLEHRAEFPGVHEKLIYLRKYNSESLVAHVLGSVREITLAQLKALPKKQCSQPGANCPLSGDQVGQGGVEQAYDDTLRGQDEIDQLNVNAG